MTNEKTHPEAETTQPPAQQAGGIHDPAGNDALAMGDSDFFASSESIAPEKTEPKKTVEHSGEAALVVAVVAGVASRRYRDNPLSGAEVARLTKDLGAVMAKHNVGGFLPEEESRLIGTTAEIFLTRELALGEKQGTTDDSLRTGEKGQRQNGTNPQGGAPSVGTRFNLGSVA